MAQHPIEIILLKQWASYMAVPIYITDASGTLVYFNEPAEPILGVRFEEVGELSAGRLAELLVTTGLDGQPIPSRDLPPVVALTERVPAHLPMRIKSFDGSWRRIEVTALPIEGQGGRHLGAVAALWEVPDE